MGHREAFTIKKLYETVASLLKREDGSWPTILSYGTAADIQILNRIKERDGSVVRRPKRPEEGENVGYDLLFCCYSMYPQLSSRKFSWLCSTLIGTKVDLSRIHSTGYDA